MTTRDDHSDIIKNEDTIIRRAWVERALQGARRRLESGEDIVADAEPAEPSRPPLYVVGSARRR
jgi:hypothetical protein